LVFLKLNLRTNFCRTPTNLVRIGSDFAALVMYFLSTLLTKYPGDQVKKNEMDEACSMYGVAVRVGFWWGKLRDRDHLEDLGVDAMIMLE
jgi:DhnA family fructose-bisphosphate aldolase class Ia